MAQPTPAPSHQNPRSLLQRVEPDNPLVADPGYPYPPIAGTATRYLYLVGRQVLIQETNKV